MDLYISNSGSETEKRVFLPCSINEINKKLLFYFHSLHIPDIRQRLIYSIFSKQISFKED